MTSAEACRRTWEGSPEAERIVLGFKGRERGEALQFGQMCFGDPAGRALGFRLNVGKGVDEHQEGQGSRSSGPAQS